MKNTRQITQFQFIIPNPPFRAGQVSCIYAKICIVYLNIYMRFTMGTALSSSCVKTLADLINEREYLAITHLIQSHSSAAINPGSTGMGTRRPYIYVCKTTSPVAHKKTRWAFRRKKKVSHFGFQSHGKQSSEENRGSYAFLHTLTLVIFYYCEKRSKQMLALLLCTYMLEWTDSLMIWMCNWRNKGLHSVPLYCSIVFAQWYQSSMTAI